MTSFLYCAAGYVVGVALMSLATPRMDIVTSTRPLRRQERLGLFVINVLAVPVIYVVALLLRAIITVKMTIKVDDSYEREGMQQ